MFSTLGIIPHSFSLSSGHLELLEVSLSASIPTSHELKSNELPQLLIFVINENKNKAIPSFSPSLLLSNSRQILASASSNTNPTILYWVSLYLSEPLSIGKRDIKMTRKHLFWRRFIEIDNDTYQITLEFRFCR